MKLSIITVVKDYPDGFRRTAESITAQTSPGIEWIVVNGSRRSTQVEDMIGEQGGHIAWSQSQADDGIYDAMNAGLDHVTGDYVVFMNAGDTLLTPHAVDRISSAIGPDTDFILNAFHHRETYVEPLPIDHPSARVATCHQAMIFKTETIDGLRYDPKYRIAGDLDFYQQYKQRVQKPLYLLQPFCRYEAGGISDKHYIRGNREAASVRHRYGVPFWQNAKLVGLSVTAGILRETCPRSVFELIRNGYNGLAFPSKSEKKQVLPSKVTLS